MIQNSISLTFYSFLYYKFTPNLVLKLLEKFNKANFTLINLYLNKPNKPFFIYKLYTFLKILSDKTFMLERLIKSKIKF